MDLYSLAFSLSNLGPKKFQILISYFGTPEKAWNGTEEEYATLGIVLKTYQTFNAFRNTFDRNQYAANLAKENVEFISYLDKRYPKSLKKLSDPPIGLFCKGNISLLKGKNLRLAVVGTRKITEYGVRITEDLVEKLAQNEVCIVSGLALGVDAAAHRTTVKNSGKTIAVLACGVNCCLPSENYSLYSDILKHDGLIVSEYPLSQPPNKGTFLARNRIVAALSDGILITEAAEKSGSLVTADFGFVLQKKVFAVPGQVGAQMSKGSMSLFKKGGILVQEVSDILSEFSINNEQLAMKNKMKAMKFTKEEMKVISLLKGEGMTMDNLLQKTKFENSMLMAIISQLEIRGIVKNSFGKIYLII